MSKNKRSILVTGGTGFLGKILVKHHLSMNDVHKVIVYSRRWNDQEKLQLEIQADESLSEHYHKMRFITGDIRDRNSLMSAMKGVNLVIHTAAYKHVTFAEYNPREVITVNIDGSQNVIDCALANNVDKVVAISTDKATDAYNIYGRTKAVMESMMVSANNLGSTLFNVARYGNVWGSTGSIIEKWANQIKAGGINITMFGSGMTRFFIFEEDLLRYMDTVIKEKNRGVVMLPVMDSINIESLVKVFVKQANHMGLPSKMEVTTRREGDKIHESLISEHEVHQTFMITDSVAGIFPVNPKWEHRAEIRKPADETLFRSDTARTMSMQDVESRVADMVQ